MALGDLIRWTMHLFDGLDRTTATRRLQEAYKTVGLPYRSWHCCRHSCATNIIGRTGDYSFARLWLGHSSPSVIERYVHVHKVIVRMALKREGGKQTFKKIDL
jgi:integrase